jgi:hypothetical protein
MTDHDPAPMSTEEAAERIRNEPALGADSPDPHEDTSGTDDDATSPDGAVSNEE